MQWNQKINLTALHIAEQRATWLYAESLWGAKLANPQGGIIDVGSGCGFPGLAFKLMNRHLPLILVESRARKTHFLKEAVRSLGLDGVQVKHARFEALFSEPDLKMNNVSWRAVELGEKLLLACLARLPSGGSVICFGTSGCQDIQVLGKMPGYSERVRQNFPGSQGRLVVQFVKCST
jgi:16S rRNA (guanine527-N7)-methyltransferase